MSSNLTEGCRESFLQHMIRIVQLRNIIFMKTSVLISYYRKSLLKNPAVSYWRRGPFLAVLLHKMSLKTTIAGTRVESMIRNDSWSVETTNAYRRPPTYIHEIISVLYPSFEIMFVLIISSWLPRKESTYGMTWSRSRWVSICFIQKLNFNLKNPK